MLTIGFLAPTTAGIVLVIALVVFGPGKLPDIGKALGSGIKEFKSAANEEVKPHSDEPTNGLNVSDTEPA